jgi:hypothetical protein
MSETKEQYRGHLQWRLRERGYAPDGPKAALKHALTDPTSLAPRHYDYFDQRWVICDQPHLPSVLRLRLSHGVDVINTFLVLVLAFELSDGQRHFWTTLLANWLDGLVRMRGQIGRRPLRVSSKLYFAEAWEGPFEGHEADFIERKVADAQDLIGTGGVRNSKSFEEMAAEVRTWHIEVAQAVEMEQDVKTFVYRLP